MSEALFAWALGGAFVVGLAAIGITRRRRGAAATDLEHHLASMAPLVLAVEARQPGAGNSHRVAEYAAALARALGLDATARTAVRAAALLRDIGTLAVPEHILDAHRPLSAEEETKLRSHVHAGASLAGTMPLGGIIAPLIRHHHERWDGTGYPDALRGLDIPLGARIVRVADHYDQLASNTAEPMSREDAVRALRREAGGSLDPALVEALARALPELEAAGRSTAVLPALDQIARARRESAWLAATARAMNSGLGLRETMLQLDGGLAEVLRSQARALFLVGDDDVTLACRFASGRDSDVLSCLRIGPDQGQIGWVAAHRAPLVNVNPAGDLAAAGWVGSTTLQACALVPLVARGRLVGVLGVYDEQPDAFDADDRRLLERLCEEVAAIIDNAYQYDRTREASLTDPLTRLPNRRAVQGFVAGELARAERLSQSLSIMVLDLNHFKTINDTFGHQAGDAALAHVAQVLTTEIRPYDICGRLAGDEFIVVMTGCDPDEAQQKLRDLQKAVARLRFEPLPGVSAGLTVSAGTASYPSDGWDYESLLAVADQRMYQQKHGRTHGLVERALVFPASTAPARARSSRTRGTTTDPIPVSAGVPRKSRRSVAR